MVYSQNNGSSTPNSNSPTPGGYLFDAFRKPLESEQGKEAISDSPATPRESPKIHDSGDLATPTIRSKTLGHTGDDDESAPHSMQGDASEGMPESSKSDHAKAGSPSHRRRSRPPLANPQRSSGQFHSQSQSSLGHALPSSSSSENVHSRHPASFQGSSVHYSSSTVPYSQRGGYVGQYTMSAQPNPMNMPHSPAPPYAFSHTYHHPVVPDNNNMMSQNIHANYPTMLQPHAPVFPFQRHSPEGSSTSHPSFSGTLSSPLYSPHQASSSPTSPHLPPSSGQTGGLTSSYVGSTPFHSLQYPSPLSTTPYPYPAQTYPPSPMYQPQFAPSPFGQHYTSTAETEPQGAWYYLPHNPSTQQYDPGPSYQGHYTVGYPQVGRSGVDSPYSGAGPSSSNIPPDPTSPYPNTPTHPMSSSYSENRTPSDSPLVTGVGPPETDPGAIAPSSSSSSGHQPVNERPVVRRSYHPNPPAHRSEWVMWAGNVPSDATHDELWRFFNQPNGTDMNTGVLSIFLISRSSCAFINYETEGHLKKAIERFNGIPLRPNDPRCPRLVCRVRRKDDDLKAGVGGQRGMGMHTRWIKEQKGKAREGTSDASDLSTSDDPSASPTSVSERLANAVSNLSMSSDEGAGKGVHVKHSSSSGSYTSTNSSFLARHFPKRYFILKSLTQEDLDISVERSVWATQRHNEEILDQAYRTSKEVYLIFSVNKSGEFYGYARMAGPVRRGEQRIPWASRPPPQVSPQSRLSEGSPLRAIFSPSDHRFVDSSPLPVDVVPSSGTDQLPKGGAAKVRHSAPAMLGEGYRLPTLTTPSAQLSLDQGRRFQVELRGPSGDDFDLDPAAPIRAVRTTSGTEAVLGQGSGSGSEGQDKGSSRSTGPSLQSVEEEGDEQGEAGEVMVAENQGEVQEPPEDERTRGEEAWGDSFAVEWICTDRVPFHRTKHLRNPWNHDREIKISRDGTELEPSVGQHLLDEWERLAEPQLPVSVGAGKPTGGKRAAGSKSVPPPPQANDADFEKAAREKPSRSR